ncbi:MAG: ABC transporter permease [Actinobacteria bacterium]|nr:ABC transporter permease [Actinomycetota bacterium]
MWLLSRKDLRLRLRDRSAFLYGIVAPFVLAAILGLVFGGVGEGADVTIGIAVADTGEVGLGLQRAFDDGSGDREIGDPVRMARFADRDAAAAAVDAGEVGAAVVVPAGTSDALRGTGPVELEVLTRADEGLAATVADAVARGLAADLTTRRVLAAVGTLAGLPADDVAATVADPPELLALTDAATDDRQLDADTYLAAGMAVFFLFFTVQFGVTSLLDERREGTLARLLAAPLSARQVVASKALTSLLLGLVSMTALVVASSLFLGASWGSPGAVALLVVAAVLSSVGLVTLLASFARTAEQASTWQSIVAVVSGMLGGAFFPVGEGAVLRALSRLTPHSWFLGGLSDIAGGAGPGAVAASLLVLVAFGAATGVVGAVRLRRGMV